MTRRAQFRHRTAVALMAVALACMPADMLLAIYGLTGWRWLTLCAIGGCAALALHLRGWVGGYPAGYADGYQAAQAGPISDERTRV